MPFTETFRPGRPTAPYLLPGPLLEDLELFRIGSILLNPINAIRWGLAVLGADTLLG